MKKENVLVAMSGGVDSAVCASLLGDQGYSVEGLTLRLWSESEKLPDGEVVTPDQNCLDAAAVAACLGFPHHCVSRGASFRCTVVEPFIEAYAKGMTPNPCVECNRFVKFGVMVEWAKEHGFERLATGHYARIERSQEGEFLLKKAKDEKKDQSYFLWSISKDVLPFLLFPLGEYTKEEIRQIAEARRLPVAHRSDSQDICFVPDGDYVAFIEKNSSLTFPEGNFLDTDGNILGKHSGLVRYTVGQRKGLGIALGHPAFVGRLSPENNTVTLLSDKELYTDHLRASRVNWLKAVDLSAPIRVEAKIRYRHTPSAAWVTCMEDGGVSVVFDQPQRAVTPGQSVVFYEGDTVLGGGIIDPPQANGKET